MDAADCGRRLAARHAGAEPVPGPDPERALLNYAERSHQGDWTLRSALVRLAQPEPVRVGTVLELMRRLDAPLHHLARVLERHAVLCDRGLTVGGVDGPPADAVADIRTADLARLVAAGVDEAALLTGYEESAPLDPEERLAVPLLALAVRFEALGERLAAWARTGPDDPPVEAVEEVVAYVRARLDELGVPIETGPPPGARSARS